MSYKFLLDLALILLSTKALGLLSKKFNLPQVVGALLAGILLGPALLNILHETDFIHSLAELGVIILMFTAGLEADVKELKKTGKAATIIAILGVFIPLIGGFLVAKAFNTGTGTKALMENIFMGVILTATSVSITVETLKELGKLSTKAGNTILGAALIDDILGIIILTVVTSLSDATVNVYIVLGKIVAFFVISIIVGIILKKLFLKWIGRHDQDLRRFVIGAFVVCLLFSYCAEHFFGVADITGAFIAGLIMAGTDRTHYINTRFETLSYMFLSPIFFASIGIQVTLGEMNGKLILLTIVLLIVAILTKVIGCLIGAKICRYTTREALQIGTGMVSRGEVALIVANKGIMAGLVTSAMLAPIVIMVVVTTVITPIFLEMVFKEK
ncbi:cation:proton antiporter [Clostridium thermobutyricum]|uniref:Na(+)/H(+)-K(+) antiporter GerN n=1 Tax=Clostridium thermobutyricum DSM 4928 TaxID=1121339 RepID=A0A1V4SYX4_9CLOT|nr:cation:proton antiporter [Clostridium thermobutyricum]OPX50425.1 Na(+)/H(+)-K(+) antiporter GerN [Clostridium thermobutyricum DSM 4928]